MPLLRACSTALANLLDPTVDGVQQLFSAELYTVTLLSGTVYRWTSWLTNLVVSSNTYLAGSRLDGVPFVKRGRWGITNTMQVPTIDFTLLEFGSTVRQLMIGGGFDGATLVYQRLFMDATLNPATYGTIQLFAGVAGKITNMFGGQATLEFKGKNNLLNVQVPKNVYQPGCIHTFCDAGCTLSASSFTLATAVHASGGGYPVTTPSLIAVAINPNIYIGGTITMTSGAQSGLVRGIVGTSTIFAAQLAVPFHAAPAVGDTFTMFQSCNKTMNQCNLTYGNLINFRGFPYVPPPDTAAPM